MAKLQLIFSGSRTAQKRRAATVAFVFLLLPLSAIGAPLLAHEIVATLPHDARDFTQGLAIHHGELFESTGQIRESAIVRKRLADGVATQRRALPADQFGEGLARAGERWVQLTWTSGIAWVYDLALKPVARFRYDGEGWGLAYDGREFLMSNGSARIARRDPETFRVLGTIEVRDGGVPVGRLNELEFANGWLYANVWQSERVAVIDPRNGAVRGWHELSALKKGFAKPAGWNESDHVLNGIAWNPDNGHFYLTGKYWPVLYEMKFEAPAAQPATGTARPQ